MKINQQFMKDNPEKWRSIRSANATFKADRWKWRKELYKADLPASALRVGLALVDEWGRNEEVFPSFDTIAEETGLKRRAVICGIEALRDAGLIVTHKTGIRDSLRYYFVSRTYVNVELREDAVKGARSSVNTEDRSSAFTSFLNSVFAEGNLPKEPDEANLNTVSSCDLAAALHDDLLIEDHHTFGPEGPQGAEVPREKDIDELLADAILDGDDTDLLPLRHQAIRDAMQRRYGSAMDHQWWIVAEWFSGNLNWIDAISELERMENGEEAARQAHG